MKPLLIFTVLAVLGASAQAASFDCAKASTPIEKTICADAQLSELDSQLMSAYKKSMADSPNADAVKAEQRLWLKEVRNSCQDAACLKQAYTGRISALTSTPIPQENDPASTHAMPLEAGPVKADQAPKPTENVSTPLVVEPQKVDEPKGKPDETQPTIASNAQTTPDTSVPSNGNGSGIGNFLAFLFLVAVVVLLGIKSMARRGNWFVLRKVGEQELHGRQVHDDLILCDTEKEMLAESKEVMNEVECPECGNHKLKGNMTVHYGPVKLFREIKTAKGYENELITKKWLYYGPSLQSGEHVKCPDCKWEMKSSRFEEFGTKAAMIIAASVAAHKVLSKTSR